MKFLITSILSGTNQAVRQIYDNVSNEIFDCNGNKINLKECIPEEVLQRRKTPVISFQPKEIHLTKLRIQLGLKCNYSCSYCSEKGSVKTIPIHVDSTSYVSNFLARLGKTIQTIKDIVLIGGEPFVYIKLMRPLVKGLKGLYPDSRLHIITNGSLLTDEIADWCIDNEINLTISHDGPSFTKYRNEKDILENPTVISAIHHYLDRNSKEEKGLEIAFNVVVTPENCDLNSLPEYFDSKIGFGLRIQFESIARLDETTEECVTSFDDNKIKTLHRAMLNTGTDFSSKNRLDWFREKGIDLAKKITQEESATDNQFSCGNARSRIMALDLMGNILVCHGDSYLKTGYGQIENFATATTNRLIKWADKPNCHNCPYLVSCLGGCPMQKGKSQDTACKNLKIWHKGLFLVAWKILFDLEIKSIEPVNC